MSGKLSKREKIELDAYERFLQIAAWRRKELGEDSYHAQRKASLEVYGDEFGKGDKPHLEAVTK